jgi:hypothetical protein
MIRTHSGAAIFSNTEKTNYGQRERKCAHSALESGIGAAAAVVKYRRCRLSPYRRLIDDPFSGCFLATSLRLSRKPQFNRRAFSLRLSPMACASLETDYHGCHPSPRGTFTKSAHDRNAPHESLRTAPAEISRRRKTVGGGDSARAIDGARDALSSVRHYNTCQCAPLSSGRASWHAVSTRLSFRKYRQSSSLRLPELRTSSSVTLKPDSRATRPSSLSRQ